MRSIDRWNALLGGMHRVHISLGNVGNSDAIELVASHATRRPAEVPCRRAGFLLRGTPEFDRLSPRKMRFPRRGSLYYYQVQPHPILAQFIQCYWAVRTGSRILPAPDHGVIPGGYVDMVFNAGDQVYMSDSGGIFFEKEKSFIVGPFDHFQRFRTEGRFTYLGVRFHPGRNPFVSANFSLEEVRNRAVPLDTVWRDKGLRAGIQAVEFRLAQVSEMAQQIACVERFLMKLLRHFQEPDPVVTDAIGSIEESKGQISVEALASALGISGRQLERKFIQRVGLSPKAFCRVTRFRQAKRLLESNPGSSGCELAYTCGYYDQTHFIHEFRRFTGQTPTRYERVRPVGFFLYKR